MCTNRCFASATGQDVQDVQEWALTPDGVQVMRSVRRLAPRAPLRLARMPSDGSVPAPCPVANRATAINKALCNQPVAELPPVFRLIAALGVERILMRLGLSQWCSWAVPRAQRTQIATTEAEMRGKNLEPIAL